jgi:hypothetical protein
VTGARQCQPCSKGDTTRGVGSTNSKDCYPNPVILVAQAKLAAAEAKAQTEAQAATQTIVVVSVVAGLVLLVVLVGGYCYYERLLTEQQMKAREAHIKEQERELLFLRDWRIKDSEITCTEKLASGAEGEVWKGTLHGHTGNVAIKRVFPVSGPDGQLISQGVWDEREVAFLMALHHEKLVHFIGAGVLQDKRWGTITFCVQGSAHQPPLTIT